MYDYKDFLRELSRILPPNERLVIDIVNGDPGDNESMRRASRKTISGTRKDWDSFYLPDDRNLYVCVMSIDQSEVTKTGYAPRRTEFFKSGVALMVDDVGDVNKERGIKVPKNILRDVPPTALVETSEGNYQAWYFFKEPLKDADKFERLIRAFISNKLMGEDPGMSSVARIARIPYGKNMKPSRNGFKVKLASLNPDLRYSPNDLIKEFGLTLESPRTGLNYHDSPNAEASRRHEEFKYHFMKEYLISADGRNAQNEEKKHEWKVICPNADNHSNGVTSGTTILHPDGQRHGVAMFMCAHRCELKTKDVIKWIRENNPEADAEWRDQVDITEPLTEWFAGSTLVERAKWFMSRCGCPNLIEWFNELNDEKQKELIRMDDVSVRKFLRGLDEADRRQLIGAHDLIAIELDDSNHNCDWYKTEE